MSINDFTNKIKKKFTIDTFTIMCLFVIIGVGISSFGLGRLSVSNSSIYKDDEVKIVDMRNQTASLSGVVLDYSMGNTTEDDTKEKRYIASRNGRLYYTIGCSGAKRISLKNAIWFNTEEEAQKSGYEFSSSCK